jgi:ribosomal protein S18 acetylase RimI-like enzyme
MDRPTEPPFKIRPARTAREIKAARDLFAAYAESLSMDLEYQGFRSEVSGLPGNYAAPKGELFVAWDAVDRAVACIGLRPLGDNGICEMKRLYVLPEARSFGLGKALTDAVIEAARTRRYSALRLDTLATMIAATNLYERMGFRRISPYYGPTPAGTIFMELELTH